MAGDAGYDCNDFITNAYNALLAVQDFNPMTQADHRLKKRITMKSIKIIDSCISEMYALINPDDNEDDE